MSPSGSSHKRKHEQTTGQPTPPDDNPRLPKHARYDDLEKKYDETLVALAAARADSTHHQMVAELNRQGRVDAENQRDHYWRECEQLKVSHARELADRTTQFKVELARVTNKQLTRHHQELTANSAAFAGVPPHPTSPLPRVISEKDHKDALKAAIDHQKAALAKEHQVDLNLQRVALENERKLSVQEYQAQLEKLEKQLQNALEKQQKARADNSKSNERAIANLNEKLTDLANSLHLKEEQLKSLKVEHQLSRNTLRTKEVVFALQKAQLEQTLEQERNAAAAREAALQKQLNDNLQLQREIVPMLLLDNIALQLYNQLLGQLKTQLAAERKQSADREAALNKQIDDLKNQLQIMVKMPEPTQSLHDQNNAFVDSLYAGDNNSGDTSQPLPGTQKSPSPFVLAPIKISTSPAGFISLLSPNAKTPNPQPAAASTTPPPSPTSG